MKGKVTLLITLTILVISLTGCWNRRELTDLSIATAMGIDKSDDGYLVTAQIINPSEIAAQVPTTRTAVTSYRTTGATVFEALRKLTKESPRKIYMSHMRTIVFGEDLAKEGIAKTLDFISRDHEFRTDFYILVARGVKATEVLNILTPLEKIPANKIYYSLRMSEKAWAATHAVQLDELISKLVSKGDNPVLTGILIKGDPEKGKKLSNVEQVKPSTLLEIDSLAAFKKDKLVGWLDMVESIGFNHITGNVKSTLVAIPCPNGGKLAAELIRTKPNVKGRVEDGKPKINIDHFVEANIAETECAVDLSKTENIYKIEKTLANEIKSKMEKAVKRAQKDFKSDIFGFGEAIHRTDPKAWKELKEDWNKKFENLEVNIKVTVKIRRLGTIFNSLQKEIKE
ncbi:MAG: spore germination protein [Candidatus Petromonas sp.]|jgi:spore germination protein KC|nr:spore germination protein [Candidatus Petromonas sp.]